MDTTNISNLNVQNKELLKYSSADKNMERNIPPRAQNQNTQEENNKPVKQSIIVKSNFGNETSLNISLVGLTYGFHDAERRYNVDNLSINWDVEIETSLLKISEDKTLKMSIYNQLFEKYIASGIVNYPAAGIVNYPMSLNALYMNRTTPGISLIIQDKSFAEAFKFYRKYQIGIQGIEFKRADSAEQIKESQNIIGKGIVIKIKGTTIFENETLFPFCKFTMGLSYEYAGLSLSKITADFGVLFSHINETGGNE